MKREVSLSDEKARLWFMFYSLIIIIFKKDNNNKDLAYVPLCIS